MILGGGFGGLATAHELKKRLGEDHQVILVAAEDRFFLGFAKLWDLVGSRTLEQGTGRLSTLAKHGIAFVQAEVTAIYPETREVDTNVGTLQADFLVVALGAMSDRKRISSPRKGSYDLYDSRQLPQMRGEVQELRSGRVVVSVLGLPYVCPPAPYEAGFLLEQKFDLMGIRNEVEVVITTPMPMPLPIAGEDVNNLVTAGLARRRIELRTDAQVSTVSQDSKVISFEDGATMDYDLFLGIPRAIPPEVVSESALGGEDGWIWPDSRTGRTTFDRVFAVGDCTAINNLPRAGVFAESLGRVVAANIVAEILGTPSEEYDGVGYCFLEFDGQRAAALEGEFFATPGPSLRMASPDSETFARKVKVESERLRAWLDKEPTPPKF